MTLSAATQRVALLKWRGSPILLLLLLLSCTGELPQSETSAIYHSDSHVLLPFPSNRFAVEADTETGIRPNVRGFIPAGDTLLQTYSDLIDQVDLLDGFGTSAAIEIGFTNAIDMRTLPGEAGDPLGQRGASIRPDCSVCIVDAATGAKVAFTWRYVQGHLLSISPAEALRPKHDYIYYVTTKLRDLSGSSVGADPAFKALLANGHSELLHARHASQILADVAHISDNEAVELVLLDRFTTQSIFEETVSLQNTVRQRYREVIENPVDTGRAADFASVSKIYEARWTEYDYRDADRRLDSRAGAPHSIARLGFYIALPKKGTQPYPVILVQHGLGDSREVIFRIAEQFAQQGFAAVAIDAPEHGDRLPPLTETPGVLGRFRESLGFWIRGDRLDLQLHKIRDLLRQTVIDHEEIRQAFHNTRADVLDFDRNGIPDLNLDTWFYYGQSMGAIVGTMTVALSPDIRVATLNVGGARFSKFLFDLHVLAIAQPVFESLWGSVANMMRMESIIQTIIESTDPINYAHLLQNEVLFKGVRRDILMQFALHDVIVPNALNWELAYQAKLPLLLPAPIVPPQQQISTLVREKITGNLQGSTGGYYIFDRITTSQGNSATATHFNTFSSLEASRQAACLFRTSRDNGIGTIYAPDRGC